MKKILEVQNLKKSYGKVEAVKGISFYMEEGSLFSFLGANGAGKSTTIDIITTFLKKDEGSVTLHGYELGKENRKIQACIGAVFQNGLLDDGLSVEENLTVRCALYPLSKQERKNAVKRVMDQCDLHSIANRTYGRLSGGQKRRCDIARALLHEPKLLFLDEPTTGLDPQTRHMIWELLDHLRKEHGTSIFLTTHYMEEAAQSNYVVVMDEGRIQAQGTPQQLKEKYAFDRLLLYSDEQAQLKDVLSKKEIQFEEEKNMLCVPLNNTMEALDVLSIAKEYLHDFEVLHGTMDDAFLQIIGKELN